MQSQDHGFQVSKRFVCSYIVYPTILIVCTLLYIWLILTTTHELFPCKMDNFYNLSNVDIGLCGLKVAIVVVECVLFVPVLVGVWILLYNISPRRVETQMDSLHEELMKA